MFNEEKLCWMKIWLRANISSNIFRLIQQNFHVGLVYSLFHPAFHSDDVISNVRTLNFEWFNKTKTLCKIITIKKSYTSNGNERNNKENSDHLPKLQEHSGEEYEDGAEEIEDNGKRKSKQTKESIQKKHKKREV